MFASSPVIPATPINDEEIKSAPVVGDNWDRPVEPSLYVTKRQAQPNAVQTQ